MSVARTGWGDPPEDEGPSPTTTAFVWVRLNIHITVCMVHLHRSVKSETLRSYCGENGLDTSWRPVRKKLSQKNNEVFLEFLNNGSESKPHEGTGCLGQSPITKSA